MLYYVRLSQVMTGYIRLGQVRSGYVRLFQVNTDYDMLVQVVWLGLIRLSQDVLIEVS
jgi:hypothetical protein